MTTPTPASKEVAEKTNEILYKWVGPDWGRSVETASIYRYMYPIIAEALTAFAERAREEGRFEGMKSGNIKDLKEARKNALLEAAGVADKYNQDDEPMPTELRAFDMHVAGKAQAFVIASEIRALAGKKEEG